MSEPTLNPATPAKLRFLPELRSPWWSALLVLSLMVNLLVAGAAIGFRFHGGHGSGRFLENSDQLLPRKFFADLPHERRREFMDMLRGKNDIYRKNRDASDKASLNFADTLDQTDFDQAKAKSIVDEVKSGPNSFAFQSEALVIDIVNKLSQDERKSLAAAIRDRVAHRARK